MSAAAAPPGRIARVFARARGEGRTPLVLYLTGGDPDLDTSRKLLVAAARAGADILEVGVPWSDPSADGPAIQAAMRRALAAGGGLGATLDLCRAVRTELPDLPLVLFGYANPIFVRGVEPFARAARAAGIDGALVVDWPPEEASALIAALAAQGIDYIPLLAPTSTTERVRTIGAAASGFLYYVSLTGITGRALGDLEGPQRHVAEIRVLVAGRLPIVVGFGISTPDQAGRVAAFADGVVVGSAAVRLIERAAAEGRDPVPAVEALVRDLRGALGPAPAPAPASGRGSPQSGSAGQ